MAPVKAVVKSSKPDPPDAKLTPIRSSSSDRFGSRKGGTVSLRFNTVAMKSGTNFPLQNPYHKANDIPWLNC